MVKRQRRIKKIKMPAFVKEARDFVFQRLMMLVIAGGLILAVLLMTKTFLIRSDYFKLRIVEVKCVFLDQRSTSSISDQLLSLYRGRNIFSLNLKAVEQSIRDAYPDAKDITVRLMLPDKLSVSLKYRKPVAVIRNDRMMAVDDEGFVLPSIDTTPLSGLVFIDGIRVKRDGNNVKAVSPKNLALALGLLKAIVASKTISAQGVASIDASKITSLSFYFKNGVEIKIGCENFDRRIGLLESTLKDPRLAIDRVKYIDVRFEEVVIGPKE